VPGQDAPTSRIGCLCEEPNPCGADEIGFELSTACLLKNDGIAREWRAITRLSRGRMVSRLKRFAREAIQNFVRPSVLPSSRAGLTPRWGAQHLTSSPGKLSRKTYPFASSPLLSNFFYTVRAESKLDTGVLATRTGDGDAVEIATSEQDSNGRARPRRRAIHSSSSSRS